MRIAFCQKKVLPEYRFCKGLKNGDDAEES